MTKTIRYDTLNERIATIPPPVSARGNGRNVQTSLMESNKNGGCDEASSAFKKRMGSEMNLVNLTPKVLKIADSNGKIIGVLHPAGEIVNLIQRHKVLTELTVNGERVPVLETEVTEVRGVPPKIEGTFYIVPPKVRNYIDPERTDILTPDYGPTAVQDGDEMAVRQFRSFGRAVPAKQ